MNILYKQKSKHQAFWRQLPELGWPLEIGLFQAEILFGFDFKFAFLNDIG